MLISCLGLAQIPMPAVLDHVVQEGGVRVQVQNIEAAEWEHLEPMLKDQLTLSGAGSANEPLADDLAFFTRQHLIREGWPQAEVRWEIQGGTIVLAVQSGVQVKVGNIVWKGDTHVLPPEEMRRFLLRASLEKENADKLNPLWVDGELTAGAALVQRRLRAEGYLESTVTLQPSADISPEGLRDLTVEIKVGPQFQFGTVAFNGAPPEIEKKALEIVASVKGGPFNEAKVQQIETRLSSLAQEAGWLDAQATSNYDLGKQGGTVDVDFFLSTGARYRVGQVQPHEDFSKGSKRVLKAGFRELEGRYYSAEDLDVAFRRALDTSMFARLDVDPKKMGKAVDPNTIASAASAPVADLVITGEETKPKTLGFEVGFDTFLGPQAGVTWRNTNLWDTGNTLAADLSWSNAGPLGSLSLKNPAFLNSPFSASARLAVETFDLFEYTRYGTSLNLELARRVNRHFSYTLFGGASINSVDTDKLTKEEIGPDLYTLTSLGLSALLDYRDSTVLPKKGWFLSARLESTSDVMGSGVSYLRTDLRGAWYRPITKKLRFAAGGALLNIQGAPAEDIPIDSRVFNGGPNSVRAFAERELGPKTKGGTPLGGTSALITNAELSYEIYNNLELAVFTDVGSLGRGNNSSPFDYSSDFRTTIGAGLRYHLPFGPIRIDYGHNTSRREGEGGGMLHVTVGFAF
ncbi:outer membrane protein [Brevifollis gellanilyticus]|uniref:Outer membrane protein n=1 Tax=Brevifollis gellanilyticus TaxID=748831 RepID=A0A512M297_9BACT|nr:outer membrane protein [Brevifollis gellanilyticus]